MDNNFPKQITMPGKWRRKDASYQISSNDASDSTEFSMVMLDADTLQASYSLWTKNAAKGCGAKVTYTIIMERM